tara:strand:- start:44 stop:1903 length:1860 start_codon:yes stop_codon:yes gene_type:complete
MKNFLMALILMTGWAHAQTSMPQVVNIPIPGSPLSLSIIANPQPLQYINNNTAASPYQLYDDGWANVPLQFTFPFYNQNFTNSTMYSNGAVQFGDPVQGFPSNNTFCCNGITIDQNTPAAYNYSILPLQTDLYGSTGSNHYSLGDASSMTYGWYGVERLGLPTNQFDFELKIDNTGNIDMRWTGAIVGWNSPAIGTIGNAAAGEFTVIQQGSVLGDFTIPGLTQITTGQTLDLVVDQCTINPLSSMKCAGYGAAMCEIDPLFDVSCSGYQAAYTTQQCAINPLYSSVCTGYAVAYTDLQCSQNTLYDVSCPGYAAAYLDYQCSIDALYSTTCYGYAEAYLSLQCTIDSLYSTSCPNYAVAYATAALLEQQAAAATSEAENVSQSSSVNNVVSTSAPSTSISSDGTVSTTVSATGDSNVDKVISTPVASTNTAAAPAAAVQLTRPQASQNSPDAPATVAAVEQKQEAKTEEAKNENKDGPDDSPPSTSEGGSGTPATQTAQSGGDKKEQPKTTRQELQERRVAAAKTKAVEEGKQLANKMGDAANMEQQVAVQGVVIAAMGFTKGFDAYGTVALIDAGGYQPYTVYNNQKNVDNRFLGGRLFGGSDRLHADMVDAQYVRN